MRSTKALVASLVTLILCSSLPPTRAGSQKPVDERLTTATSKFSFKFYHEIRKQQGSDKNTFVSPASAMLALAMTYNGADGTTRQAMAACGISSACEAISNNFVGPRTQ